jgi:hypothetical protein
MRKVTFVAEKTQPIAAEFGTVNLVIETEWPVKFHADCTPMKVFPCQSELVN